MKKLYVLILMLCLTSVSYGQDSIDTDKALLKELIIKSFDDIWSALDSNSIDTYYTKDFILLEHGDVWHNEGIADYLDKAKRSTPIPNRVNSIEFIEIKVANGMAWIAYKNKAIFTIDSNVISTAHWLESATAIMTENGWKLEMLHSTVVKKD